LQYPQALNINYSVPSLQISTKYDEVCLKVLTSLQSPKSINLITDMWTSRNMDDYITITAHSVNDEFWPINVVLDMHHMTERHNGDNTADVLDT